MVLGDDIAFIVARLKEPPFGGARYASLTGPSLSELGPDATRELCFDAFAAIAFSSRLTLRLFPYLPINTRNRCP